MKFGKFLLSGIYSQQKKRSRFGQNSFLTQLAQNTNSYEMMMKEGASKVGGGTMPEVELPTYTVVLKHKYLSSAYLAYVLRNQYAPAVVVRIQNDEVHVDLRTVTDDEATYMIETLASIQ